MSDREFSIDTRAVSNTPGTAFALAGLVVLAAIATGSAVNNLKNQTPQKQIEEAQIDVLAQDKVKVTPLIGDDLPAKHVEVKVTFPNKNASGITVQNIKGAAKKTRTIRTRVTENISVGVKHVPVKKNVSVPGLGVRKKVDHYKKKLVHKKVTHKKTVFKFQLDDWHDDTVSEKEVIEEDDDGIFSAIPGLGGGKKRTVASNIVSGVGGSFNADTPNVWGNGESFIVDLRGDLISEGDLVRVRVIDIRTGREVMDKSARATNLPYSGFELSQEARKNPGAEYKPTAKMYGPETVRQGQSATFTISANDSDGTISAIQWSNGDMGKTATYTFSAEPGTLVPITATVVDSNGNTTGARKTVRVVEPGNVGPSVSIEGPTTVERGSVASFSANASDPDGTVEALKWSTGDTGPETSLSVFETPGKTVTVKLTAVDNDGATTNTTKTFRVTKSNTTDTGGSGGSDGGSGGSDGGSGGSGGVSDPVDYTSTNSAPAVTITGPQTAEVGSNATYNVDVNDPDGTVESIQWSRGGTGDSATVQMDGVPGEKFTISVSVTDDDGATTTETWTTKLTEPPLSATIHGPGEVASGTSPSFSVSATDSITQVEWTKVGDATITSRDYGTYSTFEISASPGETVTVQARVTTADGNTKTIEKTVNVISNVNSGPTIHNIEINRDKCLPPNEATELSVTASAPGASTKIETIRWFDAMHTNAVGFGKTIAYTPDAAPKSTAEIAVKVWTNEGLSASKTTSMRVCGEQAQEAPNVQTISAEDPNEFTSTDFFDAVIHDGKNYFRFVANAIDAESSSLTYEWKFPNGKIKRTEGDSSVVHHAIDLDALTKNANGRYTADVTLTVIDNQGQSKSTTRTLTWDTVPTSTPSLDDIASLSTDSVETGEQVTLTYYPDRGPASVEYADQVRIIWGDGTSSTYNVPNADDPFTYTHEYERGGDYTVQVVPTTVGRATHWSQTITVDGGSYSVYKYKSELRTTTRVASEKPGPLWTAVELDHVERTLISEKTQDVNSNNKLQVESLLMDGWTKAGSHYEQVQVGTFEETDWQSPGSDWTMEKQDVGTTSVFDHYRYEIYDTKQDDGGHTGGTGSGGTLVAEVTDTEPVTKTKKSTTSPGPDWSKGDKVGSEFSHYDYFWRDNKYSFYKPPDVTYLYSDREKVQSAEYDTDYKYENYVTGSTSWYDTRQSSSYLTLVDTREDKVQSAEYDTDYKYKESFYDDVYRWSKQVEVTDTDYKYRYSEYRQETLHLYTKPKYEDQLFYDLRLAKYNVTTYYLYEKSGVSEEVSLSKPPSGSTSGEVRKLTYSCSNPDAPLREKACS